MFDCAATSIQRVKPNFFALFYGKWFRVGQEESQSPDHDGNLSTNRRYHYFILHRSQLVLVTFGILKIADSKDAYRSKN